MAAESSTASITTGAKFDIVGIAIGNRGRSCKKHHVCGVQVEEGTTIRLKREMILVDGLEEVVMSVYLVGGRGCRVGFTPRHLVNNIQYDGAHARVVEVYSAHDMTSTIKRRKVHHNHGFAVAELLPTKKKMKNVASSPAKSPPQQKKAKTHKEN
jgi:hypothetical protein